MGDDVGTLVEIVVGDAPAAWRSIGFAVDDDGACQVGATRIRLAGASSADGGSGGADAATRPHGTDGTAGGILGWTLAGATLPDDDLDGLPTATVRVPASGAPEPDATALGGGGPNGTPAGHPNGAVLIDHVVAITPDLDRTTAAIEATGVTARRTREAGRGRLQRFFRLGEVVLELVGPVEPTGDGPARFWGLAFTVADMDATAALLGERVSAPKPAVQPGRRIATLRKDDSVSVPVAFMSADLRGAPGRSGDASL
jgi:hypothetical protein